MTPPYLDIKKVTFQPLFNTSVKSGSDSTVLRNGPIPEKLMKNYFKDKYIVKVGRVFLNTKTLRCVIH